LAQKADIDGFLVGGLPSSMIIIKTLSLSFRRFAQTGIRANHQSTSRLDEPTKERFYSISAFPYIRN